MPAVEQRSMPTSAIEALRAYNEMESPRADQDIEAERAVRERMFGMPAELIQAPYVTLCSIWPERQQSQAFTHGGIGRKFYYMEPGSPENPSYLLVQNTFDIIQVQEGVGQLGHQAATILASQIATDLITHWTGDHPGNQRGKKGVGVIKGQRNAKGEVHATPAEIAELVKAQNGFLSFLVERADEYWNSSRPGQRDKITREHKKALRMLGLDEKQHPWLNSTVQKYNSCPRCAERIFAEANFCKHCHTDIAKYFIERDIIPSVAEWPTVVNEIERLTKSTAK